ncbi:guanylate kinase [Limosilactobacillus secaliphilus]|uniref:guanylate kinase n=1 Tax=Limosilactobacillus secaliphilus TaxID=396268 RepID=UPI00070E8A79|nr:AAA family ATPase [Limosilactobacillus secaliphilus]
MAGIEHKVYVITGAAGTGKTSVANYLRKQYHMMKVITHTTRQPRPGEQNGVDYFFETPTSMNKLHLLEKVEYDHHLYGSSMEGLQRGWQDGRDDVIVLDTAGAITYEQQLGTKVVVIFLTVSNVRVLSRRLYSRGDRQAAIHSRLHSAEYQRDLTLPDELAGKAHVIVNDDWQVTREKIDQLMAAQQR